jgi:natural product biosynthesis luciferase-like monooxygenase protein
MPALECVLVGNESLLVQCAAILKARGHRVCAVVSHAPEVRTWAEREGITLLSPGPGLDTRLADAQPDGFDWLFSIANLTLLPESVLAMARGGAVNFHDGPLPRHAGLNAPVWALIEGEAQHGITWHLIEEGVDSGDIVEQVMFDIAADDTAFSLNARCYASAIESFPAVMAGIESGAPNRRAQDLSLRSLHRRDDRPPFGGLLDFRQPAANVARLVRALDHGGYWNPLTLPKIKTDKGVFAVAHASEENHNGAPGVVLAADAEGVVVACGTGSVRLGGLSCLQGLPAGDIAEPGAQLPLPEDKLGAVFSEIVSGEHAWRMALQDFTPLRMAFSGGEGGMARHSLPPGMDADLAVAILSVFAAEGDGIAFASARTRALEQAAPGMLAGWVPASLGAGSLADRIDSLAAIRMLANAAPSFARDLISRDPALGAPGLPVLGLAQGRDPIAGVALCVCAHEEGCELVADLSQVDAAMLDLCLSRLWHMANADLEAEIAALDLFSPADAALMARINETARPFDAITLQQAFERQAAQTPDAPALAFEDTVFTYSELNARANRAAHVLRTMGVRPGVPVGLCVSRGPMLLEGALAILKAGGAYVPMDPGYPADRLAHYLADSGAPVIVAERGLLERLPPHGAELLILDTDARLATAPVENPQTTAGPDDLAYVIYTSGSTGTPKGVMVEHRNIANFFAGMDERIPHEAPGAWLAVTSINFDISVLELFWTLARGFKVVLTSDEGRLALSGTSTPVSDGKMDFSLFFWGNDDGPGPRKYQLLLDAARFADTHGFSAVWTPERHFHAFGGPYPNPGITGAAVAAVTKNIGVRAGSIVAPLHHPLRIAEDWAVIDNLTNGRSGLGIASGWHPVDFVLRPENAPPNNKKAMFETIDTLRRLWRGEAVEFDRGGEMVAVQSLPRPVSKEAPIWLTIAGNPDTWREAGEIGANVLTHLLGQSIDEVAEKIKTYHAALRGAGHDPADFTVTLMLHTYIARSREQAREVARGPMKSYLLSAAALVKQYAWAFPAFKRPAGVANPMEIDLSTLSQDEVDGILDYAFSRYFEESGLFGTVEDGIARVEQLKAIGVSEIGCLIDYGIAPEMVMEGLFPLAEVLRRANSPARIEAGDHSIAAQIRRHGVTHLQCTPSMARLFLADPGARAALSRVQHMMIGGEALPGALAREVAGVVAGSVQNMYGPTETTIWSTTGPASTEGTARLGAPIANTTLHVLDANRRPVPVGIAGELWIGGAGVTRGYWKRPELTKSRFAQDPATGGRIYGTGDLVRMAADGSLEFLGRMDHQVKIRGHRIELGEVEAALEALPGVAQAVVVARADAAGDLRLVGYIKGSAQGVQTALAARLPAIMIPQTIVEVQEFPLTPNRKIDRNALPEPVVHTAAPVAAQASAPASTTEAQIAQVWSRVLGVSGIRGEDNFFTLGGHSLLAVQAHRELRSALGLPGLSITDVFRFPVLGALARHIDARLRPVVSAEPPATKDGTQGEGRLDAMARRRQMRAERLSRLG